MEDRVALALALRWRLLPLVALLGLGAGSASGCSCTRAQCAPRVTITVNARFFNAASYEVCTDGVCSVVPGGPLVSVPFTPTAPGAPVLVTLVARSSDASFVRAWSGSIDFTSGDCSQCGTWSGRTTRGGRIVP